MQSPRTPSSAGGVINRPGHQASSSSLSSTGSGTTTPPLKIAKQTTAYASSSSLVGGVKGGAPLARRQSASFNHVRTSSLVSSSPFKTGGNTSSSTTNARPRPQHTSTQSQHGITQPAGRRPASTIITQADQIHLRSRSDENRHLSDIRRPRESKGFQNLPKIGAVTKNPLVEANGVTSAARFALSKSSSEYTSNLSDSPTAERMVKSATMPSVNTSNILPSGGISSSSSTPVLAPNHSLASRPLPGAPQKPTRPLSMVALPSSSSPVAISPGRSSLVSKRLIGPRSPEGSPAQRGSGDSPSTRQRRKTVTWDERCDVVEFDRESVTASEVSQDSERSDQASERSEEEDEYEDVSVKPAEIPNDFFGPDRENGRSPSPILSGSINDGMDDTEDLDTVSANSFESDHDAPTPQKKPVDLPVPDTHDLNIEDYGISLSNIPGVSDNAALAATRNVFRDDNSMSIHDEDSFTRRMQTEPEVETSFRFSETPRSPEKLPRISREAVRRQIDQQRTDNSVDGLNFRSSLNIDAHVGAYNSSRDPSPGSRFTQTHYSPAPSPASKSHQHHPFSSSFDAGNRSNVNLEDLEDAHSALDRLMLGVEKGFEPSINSNVSDVEEDDRSYRESRNERQSSVPDIYDQASIVTEATSFVDEEAIGDHPLLRHSTAMSGASTATTDEPMTPQVHDAPFSDPTTAYRDDDVSSDDDKPLPPPPPESYSPAPAVHITLDDEEIPKEASGPSLSVPAVTVRRGSTIKKREEAIKAKRREQRALEGRPSRRRSQSTGDLRAQFDEADQLELAHQNDPDLTDAFQLEVEKLQPVKKSYMMKQRRPTIYASDSRVGHLGAAGDVHGGRAWRTVRRPSDMNEYSRQIRQIRQQEKAANTQGKVFVKVIGIRELDVLLPSQPTYFTCVLNNGIHFVETPPSRLEPESLIDQEFELIEHEKLEFTLTIKIRKDAHISQMLNPPPRPTYAPPPPRVETPTKSKGGMRSFFSSPAKKPSKPLVREREPIPQPVETTDPFGKYLKKDLSIAKALVSFKEIVSRCDTKLFETSYPLVGQCSDGRQLVTKAIGEIVLQIFRLPAIPGVPQDDLPQSLDDCLRGLRHVQWHKVVYHEGVLTQLGGDCTTWRRRNLRVLGASLIAYNDITKKPITTMDLRKVTLVEDDGRGGVPPTIIRPPGDPEEQLNPPKRIRRQRSFNALAGIEHSFRMIFDGNENDEVCFFADSAEEKTRWMEIFGALVGRIPHNPLWAELVWQRQQEVA
ncbi:hypothetical protein M408DRAFT_78146 [Serendipita vermifera MAFF 305830]|uniref:PH domain-containing protein n=1 Tax=Serendipita vermifera MAFF 305830 TaxID=933852 RepID=A0A0C2X0G9_SERVB|nr:hypothetical protein M408DRAFT_78146 [Serendipita vermifera MAFF 305830]